MSASKNKVVVTSEQESEARECFAMFDSDNDGFILKKEVPMLFMSLGKNPTQKEINTLMAKHKSRRKDRVSVDEFIYLLKQGIGGSGEPGGEMMEGLKIYDDMMSSKPGTGSITEGELRHIMAKFGEKLNKEELAGLMDFAKGASKNGKVDYAMFVDKLVNPHKYKDVQ